MPTGRGSDLVPVSKETKRRLARAKGRTSFDALLRALMDELPPDGASARVRASEEVEIRRVERLRRLADAPRGIESARSPEKQLLIAELAEQRWARWLREGRVERIGPRHYRWNVASREGVNEPRVPLNRLGRGRAP